MATLEFWHHHLGVSVPDLDASIEWYGRVLEFSVERRVKIESIPADVAVLRNGPLHIELFCARDANPLPPGRRVPDEDIRTHGNKHAAFAVQDVVGFAEELRRRGADVVSVQRYPNGRANCFVRDNAGNVLEFLNATKIEAAAAILHAKSE
jgi:catechol 2,3-dioxygenase-like lactoylglutathione lyase family enzyme